MSCKIITVLPALITSIQLRILEYETESDGDVLKTDDTCDGTFFKET